MKNTAIRIVLGIIASTAVMALLFFFFMFWNPLGIHKPNTLKWIPVLIAVVSMYVSGKINNDTPLIWLPLLFLSFIIFSLFNFTWFPFILVLIVTGILTLAVTRKVSPFPYSKLSWAVLAGIFLFFLFSQPLIFEKEGFRRNVDGELVNASVAWDFTEDKEKQLTDHVLLDENGAAFNLATLQEKTYLVSFWATWCAPCLKTKPALEHLKKDYADNPRIGFIDVSFDEDQKRWKQYLEKNNPAGRQLISKDPKKTTRALNFAGIPTYFIVNPDGTYQEYGSFEVAEKAAR